MGKGTRIEFLRKDRAGGNSGKEERKTDNGQYGKEDSTD